MKIQMRALAAGADGVLQPDKVYDLPKKQAEALIEGGYAVAVFDQAVASRKKAAAAKKAEEEAKAAEKRETADSKPPEKAIEE